MFLAVVLTPVLAVCQWEQVGDGIHYRQFRLEQPPNDAFVARMQINNPSCAIDSVLAQGRISGGTDTLETVRGMARRYDDILNEWGDSRDNRNKVVVAMNGDYYWTKFSHPEPFKTHSGQIQSGWFCRRFGEYAGGSGFVFKRDRSWFIGGDVSNGEKYKDAVQTVTFADGSVMKLDRLNVARGNNEVVLYTPQYGDSTETSSDGIEVLVQAKRPLGANERVPGVVQTIRRNAPGMKIPFDCVVLSTHGSAADSVAARIRPGDEISLNLSLKDASGRDWTGAYASIGGHVTVVKDGRVPVDKWEGKDWKDHVHPRSCVACNDEYIFFVVVDGRSERSHGMTFEQLGNFCKDMLGATWAISQDGGGSSTLVVNDKVLNVPSDGRERSVANGYVMVNVQPGAYSRAFSSGQSISLPAEAMLRLGPGTNYGVNANLDEGTAVEIRNHPLNGVLAKGTHWWNVQSPMLEGWISEEQLSQKTSQESHSTFGTTVKFTDSPPVLDGLLNEPVWQNAGRISGFLLAEGSLKPEDDTEVLLLYDEQALYLGFIAKESNIAKVQAEQSGRDAFVWRDEAVEAFLDVGDASTAYFQVATNIKGSMFDLLEDRAGNLRFEWNGNWEVRTSLQQASWTAEFRIPFSELGVTESPKGTVWKVNFTRCDYAGTQQNSAWGATVNFHNQEAFKEIHFE